MIIEDKHKNFKTVPAAYILFLKGNKILLLKRQNTGFSDGFYSLPAGHLDGGESAVQAGIREAKEEVGVEIEKSDMVFAQVMYRTNPEEPYIGDKNTLHERVDFFFATKKWSGELINAEPNKCEKIKWFNINKLPDNIIPYVKKAIESYKDKVFYSEVGWEK